MSIQFVDLKAQYHLIKEEIDVERLLNEGESYVEELLQD